jgi:hypothetical protein
MIAQRAKPDAFSFKEISKVTGLSLAACSRIRADAKVPHPRHWDPLTTIVNNSRVRRT